MPQVTTPTGWQTVVMTIASLTACVKKGIEIRQVWLGFPPLGGTLKRVSGQTLTSVWLVFILQLFLGANALGNGNEVVVVYNTQFPGSRQVADHYALKRNVPAEQVLALKMAIGDAMTRDEFRSQLQLPLAKILEEQNLWEVTRESVARTNGSPRSTVLKVRSSRIRYVVLCYGVPFRISEDPALQEEGAAALRAELRHNEAAVDSELAWLPILGQKPLLAGWLPNPAYSTTNSHAIDPSNGMLMVTRLDGPSKEIAMGLVDKAIDSESNGFWGRAYFDLRNTSDPKLKQGDKWLGDAAEICRRLGFETVIDKEPQTFSTSLPLPQIAIYAGWYDANVSGPFSQEEVEFMPGAFAYHLHSFSASRLRSPDQNWVGPLLARGATITMGSVAEPFLTGTPDIAVFCHRLLYAGFTFGESAYAAAGMLSWQTTVVGDPLYRPSTKVADLNHSELQESNGPFLEWSYLRLININLAASRPMEEIVRLLESLELLRTSAILTEKLGDLYAAQGKPSSAVSAWEQGLKLHPSPQEHIGLRLKLADKLVSLGRQPEASDQLEQLLKESPQYPGRSHILQRLASLSPNSEDTNGAAQGLREEKKQPNQASQRP
jgi:uncharacterized protein (TIGR03790 family)